MSVIALLKMYILDMEDVQPFGEMRLDELEETASRAADAERRFGYRFEISIWIR